MKRFSQILLLLLTIGLWACSGNAEAEAAAADQAEAAKIDSVSQVIETTTEALHDDKEALENALDELDALFPEEQ